MKVKTRNSVRLPLTVLGGLLLCASAGGNELHWTRLDVQAELDREGRLHVAERQAIVFNGDWNGGERVFNLRTGQKLKLNEISRIDAAGAEHPLREGDLSAVDDYDWHDASTLRWRSRLPSDPPFENTEIVYLLDYTLENILVPRGGSRYLLDHDFAFPNRNGVIEQFTLTLNLDDAWVSQTGASYRVEKSAISPGESVVVNLPLEYAGADAPEGVYFGVPPRFGASIAALFLAAAVLLFSRFYLAERAVGRWDPLISAQQIDGTWLQENLLKYLPEVVGAAWDERTSAPEVAAVLARMTAEGRISSRIEPRGVWIFKRNELFLNLLVDPEKLEGYEAALVKAFFFDGSETSTAGDPGAL